MLVKTYAGAVQGIDAVRITIETTVTKGMSEAMMVGMPDTAVRESLHRIWSAMKVNAYHKSSDMFVINLAPADIRKEGAAYDLPIAIGILAASEQVKASKLDLYMMMGELSLDGSLKPIHGVLPIAIKAKEDGFRGIILPEENAAEAAVVEGLEVYGMTCLLDVTRFLDGIQQFEPTHVDIDAIFSVEHQFGDLDFADVKGQENVKRALEVAAAGGHNVLMVGSPGAGKSMMAKRLPSILPPLTLQESLETTKIHSVAGQLNAGASLVTERPFRSPHHTVSDVALVGGGLDPKPGEISMAHNGVLFLDELPEYKRSVLEVMRQPLEDRKIVIARSKMTVEYPASFMLVAAMNPCPCGHYNDPTRECTCTPTMVHKYLGRISGPLLDRIDIQVEITPVPFADLEKKQTGEHSATIRERVVRARRIQAARFANETGIHCNAQMNSRLMRQHCVLDEQGTNMIRYAMERLALSARAYDRILKVARTIADIEGEDNITVKHLAEAIGYRNLDREGWAG